MIEDVQDARATVQLAIVRGIDDAGLVQRVTVETTEGYVYDRVEVMQPAGFASVPASDGAIVLLLAVGGDPANWRALPVNNPSRRMGGLGPGETVLYGADGSRVAILAGGTVDVQAATHVKITAPAVTITTTGAVTLNAAGGVTIGDWIAGEGGTLQAKGNVSVTGVVSAANFTTVGAPPQVAAGIVAGGGGQAGATKLTSPINVVSDVAAGQGVKVVGETEGLPRQEILNAGTVDLTVYPRDGAAFKGMSAGAPVTLPQGAAANITDIGGGTFVVS